MPRPAAKVKPAPTGVASPVMVGPRFPVWLLALLLALVTLAAYWPVTSHDFVTYDDPAYVTDNAQVQGGLTWHGLRWAFGRLHGEETYWHPLTWASHMLDCQLFGLKPAGHHFVNLLFHTLNTVLVFLVFRRITGAFWHCAVLAALFALHPLQVDTAAWVAERKNLLSTLFWLLTMWAYVRYAQESGVQSPKSKVAYVAALGFFTLGLMCKPVLITLPFVLLLLDYWPLQRLQLSTQNSRLKTLLPLLWEKLPFFALAMASSAITLLAHRSLGSLETAFRLPLDLRLENALISYVRYLGKTIWPANLAVFYPYPPAWPAWQAILCGLLLLAVSGLVIWAARTRPYLFVGWFWFLGVLVPFIGLIQAGAQAMADRFAYVPLLGLLILLLWGMPSLVTRWHCRSPVLSVAAGVAILLCLLLTRQQLGHWKNSETLFRHALAVTENNWPAHINLGDALDGQGRTDEAIHQYQEAIRLNPACADAHNNLGNALLMKGQIDEAINQYQQAIRLEPDHVNAHSNLGGALFNKGRMADAISQYQEAIRLKPGHALAHYNLGNAFYRQGRIGEAISQFREALRLRPGFADARCNLEAALAAQATPQNQPAPSTHP